MSEIVPEDFDLQTAINSRSSTENDQRKRCPDCKHLNITPHVHSTFEGKDYRCNICGHHFNEPVRGMIPEGCE